MDFHEIRSLVDAAVASAEAVFVRDHPHPAFVFERFEDGGADAGDPTQTQEISGRLRASGRFRIQVEFEAGARVCWIPCQGGAAPALSFGRDAACDFVLKHPTVSRKHASVRRISSAPGSGWLLDDLGSRNGTTVNGQPLTCGKVRDGDIVTLGGTVTFRTFFTPGAFYRYLHQQSDAPK
ncbi:FHA domain-containing protein [bacterium]|nr:FHA domain-containing protein [bacterium]